MVFWSYRKKRVIAAIGSALFLAASCAQIHDRFRQPEKPAEQPPAVSQGVLLPFGNPSNATSDPKNEENYLLAGENSTFSYSESRGTVNWISWKTTKADLGEPLPRPDFRPDTRLPKNFPTIGYYDYSGSGYDRGHMVPSADRFANPRLNDETFVMTNIVPQTGSLNQYPWNQLEMYARSEAWRGFDVYQIAGVYGDKGRLKDKVTVPTNCWKIIAF